MALAVTRPAIGFRFRPLVALRRWSAARRQRLALAQLDEARLRDIGVSRAQAQAEAMRPFWDAPVNWFL